MGPLSGGVGICAQVSHIPKQARVLTGAASKLE